MIKNLILDFGDVFINLDKPATLKEMKQFGLEEFTPELDELCKNYEMGLVTTEVFLNTTSSFFPEATGQQLIDAWNAILLDFPEERLIFLERLAHEKKYRLFLLSNTNELHIAHEREKMGKRFERFQSAFEVFYLSYEMKMRKPDTKIFEFVLQENGLIAAETLFVDDTKENIDAAGSLGIQTWHLQIGKEDIVQLKNQLNA